MNATLKIALALITTALLHAGSGLAKAAIDGDIPAVKQRLAAGENINEPGKNGWTPLMWAVWYRQLPITELLLEKGANPNIQATDSYKSYAKGTTALIIASFDCLEDEVTVLVKHKATVDLRDANGNTAESYARKSECPAVVRALGFKAAANRELDVLLEGIAAGKDINALDKFGWVPLMWAVYYEDLLTTEFLLQKGADPNVQSTIAYRAYPKGTTALIIAGCGGMADQASALLKHGAKVGITDSTGRAAGDYARKNQNIPVLTTLGMPANEPLEIMLKAIKSGKDVNAIDQIGWTPLMWAVYYQDLYSAKSLLELGADPNIQSTDSFAVTNRDTFPRGVTALMIASKLGQEKMATILLGKKAKVYLADTTGNTADSYAYENSYYDFLELLVDRSPLEKSFGSLVIFDFTGSASISKEYPNVFSDSRLGLLETVTKHKGFERVEIAQPGKSYEASSLLLRAEVIQLHIPSGAARFFIGPLAGRTNMDVKVTLVDAATGSMLREQIIRSANSIWLSAFTLGIRDENFAKETGAAIAGWVLTLVGKAPPSTDTSTSN